MLKFYYKSKKLLFYTQADVSFITTTYIFLPLATQVN